MATNRFLGGAVHTKSLKFKQEAQNDPFLNLSLQAKCNASQAFSAFVICSNECYGGDSSAVSLHLSSELGES